ncbi:hypothetical protein SADUNF_Sadunf16G0260300 [Salix dunnii]|uniref:NAC domain-containing protein n=1 Tax=Salix dunnii TaxID=1413687 RepID=A0A835MMT6_9ROSI|nr:hypothetical protein SADUNF_Sadunf16G0260300 [Salix dunnii]
MESYHHFGDGNTPLPPGFRFHPTDEELITYYLLKKVLDRNFTGRAIAEVDLNKCEPWELPGALSPYRVIIWIPLARDLTLSGMERYRASTAVFFSLLDSFWKSNNSSISDANNFVDEWVISRVFQKSCGGAAASSGNITKKNRFNTATNLYNEASSPSSVSLPPLLDATATTTTATLYDGDSFSYVDSHTQHEHVSCFSTIVAAAAANSNTSFDLAQLPPPPMTDPFSRFPENTCVSCFPSLRSIQENLQQPFFFASPTSAVAVPPFHGGVGTTTMNWMVNP